MKEKAIGNIQIITFVIFIIFGIVVASIYLLSYTENENSVNESTQNEKKYLIVDTGQTKCYDNTKEISCPEPKEPFYGQDAQHERNKPEYKNNNNDGTVTDLNTGLMWQKTPPSEKLT